MLRSSRKTGILARMKTSVWTFPLAILGVLLLLTAFRVSGTSAGVYHQALYGADSHDSSLIYGKPRAIRSDEWLSTDQLIYSQVKNGNPAFNQDLGSGRSVVLSADLPSKDWSTVFKPQNWSFFVLPLEYAFALKWWLLMYLVIVSCYFFILRILPGQRLFAATVSLAVGLSPFELWWYQPAAYLSVAYGFFATILVMRIADGDKIPRLRSNKLAATLHGLALGFVLACFGLIAYPPFQIPVAIALGFFSAGYFLNKKFNDHVAWPRLLKRLAVAIGSVVVAGLIGGMFIVTHKAPIEALNHTLYPGSRTISSGGFRLVKVFATYLQPQLQSDFHGSHFVANQSEDSSFILLMPFLLLPGLFLMVYEYVKKRRIDWVFAAIQICSLVFLARMFVHFGSPFYRLLLLQKVPHERLVISLGFVGIMQSVYLLKKLSEYKFKQKVLIRWAAVYSLGCLVILWLIGLYVRTNYPLFINRRLEIFGLAALFSAIIFFWLANRRLLAAGLFLIFTIGSSFKIIPLYQGLGFVSNSTLATRMHSVSGPNTTWGTLDVPLFQNMGLLADRRSLTGTEIYPDMKFWNQVNVPNHDFIFNRQAHVMLSTDPALQQPARLVISDFFELKFDCSQFIRQNLNYALSIHPVNYQCAQLVDTVKYPQITFYLYKILQ